MHGARSIPRLKPYPFSRTSRQPAAMDGEEGEYIQPEAEESTGDEEDDSGDSEEEEEEEGAGNSKLTCRLSIRLSTTFLGCIKW